MASKYKKIVQVERLYRINDRITAPEVRLIDEYAKQIGLVSLAEAKQYSYDSGKDLIEIVSKANPPIVKLIELSKFKYQESKKLKTQAKGDKRGGELKEIQLTLNISQNDYDTRIRKAKSFLSTGNKVKLNVKYKGREITKKEFGFDLASRFQKDLSEISAPEGEPKLIGKRLQLILKPVKSSPKSSNNEETIKETQS